MGEKQHDTDQQGGIAVLVGVATAVAGFVPAAFLYDKVTRFLRPVGSGEGHLAQSLDVLFIGGPICALILAITIGLLTYRSRSRHRYRMAIAFVLGCVILSAAILQWSNAIR